jgi:predicted MFS family arabinose efflux permease
VSIGLYNVGDFIGKTLPNLACLRITKPRTLYALVACHALFIILFVAGIKPAMLPAFARAEWYPLLITHLLGLCTGFLGTSGMMLGPQQVPDDQKQYAGMLQSCFLILGLSAGSWLGMLVSSLASASVTTQP